MTIGASSNSSIVPQQQEGVPDTSEQLPLPEAYDAIRNDPAIQFEPLQPKALEPVEPSWLEQVLTDMFGWLAQLFAPLAQLIVGVWPVLQWVLLAALIGFVLYLIGRLIGPMADRRRSDAQLDEVEPEWQPDREESLALLEDADRLASQGRFDEAAHLLLKRSVGQIAAARPEWVDPSSTARELAALPRLSDAARRAFTTISEAVERSLFALKTLSKEDWEVARSAYADFALARIDGGNAVLEARS